MPGISVEVGGISERRYLGEHLKSEECDAQDLRIRIEPKEIVQ
jgi:hypothetical protein